MVVNIGEKIGKKILVVSLGMEIGGAERSLLTMLSELDYSKAEVDLFLLHRKVIC